MVVAVGGVAGFEATPTVRAVVVLHVHHVYAVDVLRVGVDAGIVPGALAQGTVVTAGCPGLTGVVANVHATRLLVFDDGVDATCLYGAHRYATDAPDTFR